MERNHPIKDLMETTMQKLREMVDVNTIVGQPITTPDGTTLIPVSTVSMGFGSGGGDYGSKKPESAGSFGGGAGAGVNISPVAFIVVKDGFVRLLPMATAESTTLDRVVEMVPEIIDKVDYMLNRNKEKETGV